MNVEIIVMRYDHYSIEDKEGLSVMIAGNNKQAENFAGVDISQANVPYSELQYLKTIPFDHFPARFSAEMDFSSISKNGKKLTGASFLNLKFKNKVDFVDVSNKG